MGDGYSDKSVSPLVYQPAADNDPQAISGVYEPINGVTVANSTFDATIIPGTLEWLFRKFGLPCSDVFQMGGSGSSSLGLLRTVAGTWLVANNYSRKIFRSIDNGNTWQLVYTGASNKLPAQIVQISSGRIISGAAYSDDDGSTWQNYSFVTSTYRTICTGIGAGRVITVTQPTGTPSLPLIIYSDDGVNWSTATVSGSVSDSDFPKVKYLGSNVWFCGGGAGGFYLSRDHGATWTQHKIDATYNYGRDAERLPDGKILVLHQSSARISDDDGVSFSSSVTSETSQVRQTIFKIGTRIFVWGSGLGANGTQRIFEHIGTNYLTQKSLMPLALPFAYPRQLAESAIPRESQVFLDGNIAYVVVAIDSTSFAILKWAWNEEQFIHLPSFSATSPAKLSSLITATAQLVTAEKSGTVKLYLQHTNDAVTTASSLADVAGAWTDCGALTHDTPLSLPSFTARAGEVIYPRIGFTCTDTTGVSPAPELSSIAFAWASDVTAPDSPTITRIVNTSGDSTYGYRVDFGALPAGSRHLIVEGKKNDGDYTPFNNKAQWDAGEYMKLRGSRDAVEEAGERNETSLSSNSGFVVNDTAQVKVAAEDAVGNRSAFVESEVVTMADSEIPFVPVFVDRHSAKVRKRLKAIIRR